MNLRPLADRVIVKRVEQETKTASGIVIPDAAAEKPDVGEFVEILQGDNLGLRSAHGQASHGTIWLIGQRAEIGVNVRDQFANEHLLEGFGCRRKWVPAAATSRSPSSGSGVGARGRRIRSSSRRSGSASSTRSRSFVGQTVGHHDDEGLGLSLGDQVIHDQRCKPLDTPPVFVLTPAML